MPPLINRGPVNYDSPKELRAFLDERGLGMRKKFGQNFLINSSAREKLLDALEIRPGDNVWEIGPGLGAMTAGLLERGGRVTAFEIDPAFARILREFFIPESSPAGNSGPGNSLSVPAFRLVEGDVLKTWPAVNPADSSGADPGDELFLLGNLPYNIAAVLLADFIEKGRFFKRIVVTVQREVAERMAAGPGSPDYSSFSVLCASAYKVSLLPVIKGSCFYPAPRVDSRGVRLDFVARPDRLPALFYPLVRGLFSARRKTIKNTLTAFSASGIMGRAGVPAGRPVFTAGELAAETLKKAGLSGDRRPETLTILEFAALAAFLEETVLYG